MGIVRFALKFPYTFYVLAALIVFLGGTAIVSMPTDIFPQINIPVVTVIWQYTGLSTPEMEQRVTTYSQYSISSNVTGIKNIEAQTLNGISVQKVYFQPDVNLDLAIAQIVAATNAIRALLPVGIQPPIVVQYNASSVPVLQLTLSSDNLNEQQPGRGQQGPSGFLARVVPRIVFRLCARAARRECRELPPSAPDRPAISRPFSS
jgi:multidrug efflux pump subunit AcrB